MTQHDTAQYDVIVPVEPVAGALPVVRTITLDDVQDALRKGLDDFLAMPSHVVFLCWIYPIVGILLGRATFGLEVIPLLYPLAAGFALIGPIAAIGLYELSRRREAGLDTHWQHAFDIRHSPSLWPILALGALLLTWFCIWIAIAHAIYVANFGYREPTSLIEFAKAVATTPEGHRLVLIGNVVGGLFAVAAFVLSVVSFPLLLDRNVGFPVAVLTSVKAVLANPVTMAVWGALVVGGLVIGSLPFFMGLPIVLPVLGHSTWHLYRKVVEPDTSPRPQFHPRETTGERYGAQFPASLFARDKAV